MDRGTPAERGAHTERRNAVRRMSDLSRKTPAGPGIPLSPRQPAEPEPESAATPVDLCDPDDPRSEAPVWWDQGPLLPQKPAAEAPEERERLYAMFKAGQMFVQQFATLINNLELRNQQDGE